METPQATSAGSWSLSLRYSCETLVHHLLLLETTFEFVLGNVLLSVLQGNRDERENVDISLAKQDAQVKTPDFMLLTYVQ